MIASLTFTYSNNRYDLVKFKSQDKVDRYFRNKLDKNFYVFHNSTVEYQKQVIEGNLLSDFKLTFGSIQGSYPQALKAVLLKLKDLGITKVVYMQDDVFSSCGMNTALLDDLVNHLRIMQEPYLNLEYNDNQFDKILHEKNTFKVLDTDTNYFVNKKMWSFDDSCYCGNIDYILHNIYDETYFSYPDIWSAEWYLKYKFERNPTKRNITNIPFFRRVNLVGENIQNKQEDLKLITEYLNDL